MIFKIYIIIAIIMSIITFTLYGIDKKRSMNNKWRIREFVLLLFSCLLGALGGYLGMLLFHHKTKKWYFTLINILALVIQVVIAFRLAK